MVLLSRVAESLYWLGRYNERAENTARLLDVAYHGRLEPGAAEFAGATNPWGALVASLGVSQQFHARAAEADEESVIAFLTVDLSNPSSILSCLAQARENARSVRDYLSSETWVSVNRLYHATAHRNVHLIMADGLYDFCDVIRQGAHLVYGTVEGTSLHDEGWQWLRAGLLIERADMITRIVDSKYHLLLQSLDEVGGTVDRYQWTAVLRGVSGYEAFRRTHVGGVGAAEVAEFVLLNPAFPRSLRWCVERLRVALDNATEGAEPALRNPALRLITGLESRLRYHSVKSLFSEGMHEFLRDTQRDFHELQSSLSASFFWSRTNAA